MRWWWAAACALVLAGCLEASPASTGDGAPDPRGEDASTSESDGGLDCEPQPSACPAIDSFTDNFETLDAWIGPDDPSCTITSDGDGVRFDRETGAIGCFKSTVSAYNLRCRSVYIHLDPATSPGAWPSFTVVTSHNNDNYYFSRRGDDLYLATCPGASDCEVRPETRIDFDPQAQFHWRFRGTTAGLAADLGGPDEPPDEMECDPYGTFPEVTEEELGCVYLLLSNDGGAATPSTAIFTNLNL